MWEKPSTILAHRAYRKEHHSTTKYTQTFHLGLDVLVGAQKRILCICLTRII